MKLLPILLATLFASSTFSQEVPVAITTKPGKFQIGINFSPDYCERILKNDEESSSAKFFLDYMKKFDSGKLGYSTGINLSYNVSSMFVVETGLQYSNKGYATE